MISAPSFRLPPCPACSALILLERPFWRLARNSTAAAGAPRWILSGCAHARAVSGDGNITGDLDQIELVESAWAQEIARLFAARTANWTERERDAFARALADRSSLSGATERFNFNPETSGA